MDTGPRCSKLVVSPRSLRLLSCSECCVVSKGLLSSQVPNCRVPGWDPSVLLSLDGACTTALGRQDCDRTSLIPHRLDGMLVSACMRIYVVAGCEGHVVIQLHSEQSRQSRRRKLETTTW